MDILSTNIKDVVTRYRTDLRNAKDTTWANKIFLNLTIADEFHREYRRQLKEDKFKRYVYMLTFTVNPDKYKKNDDEIEDFIIRQSRRDALKLVEFAYVKEFCKSGLPHWHALLVTLKPLKKDRFNYYISKYGNIDISKNRAQQTDEILNYMTKSGDLKRLK